MLELVCFDSFSNIQYYLASDFGSKCSIDQIYKQDATSYM